MQEVVLGVSDSRKQQGCKQRDKYSFVFVLFFANYVIAALFWPFSQKQKSGNVEPSKLNFEDETTFLAHCE